MKYNFKTRKSTLANENHVDIFFVDAKNIRTLDKVLTTKSVEKFDFEIEEIISNFWRGVPDEDLLKPLFTTYLQANLLRPLYIQYHALNLLKKKYHEINIRASTAIVDIIASGLNLKLDKDRSFHDEDFLCMRRYHFMSQSGRGFKKLKILVRQLFSKFHELRIKKNGVAVIFLDAGKLSNDFKKIPNALDARFISTCHVHLKRFDVDLIVRKIKSNIEGMNTSIPNNLVLKLIEKIIFPCLPFALMRIEKLADFIASHGVKLAIASAATHEDHLCLLAAARLSGIKSLIISHGFTMAKNQYLENYVTYQATLNRIEHQYSGATQFSVKAEWFER